MDCRPEISHPFRPGPGIKNPERLACRMLVWAWVEDGIRGQPQVREDVRPKPCFFSLDSISRRYLEGGPECDAI